MKYGELQARIDDIRQEVARQSSIWNTTELLYNDLRGWLERHHKDVFDEYCKWRYKRGKAILVKDNGKCVFYNPKDNERLER